MIITHMQRVERTEEAGARMELCDSLGQLEGMEHFNENMHLQNCLASLFLLKTI